jgi:chromosome segregation ATPase
MADEQNNRQQAVYGAADIRDAIEREDVLRSAADVLESSAALLARVRELEQELDKTLNRHADVIAQNIELRREVRELERDQEGHLERANAEIAKRQRAEIAYTQSEQKRLVLVDARDKTEATVRELEQARDEARRAATELLTALGVAKDHIAILRDELEARDAASAEGAD